MARSEFGGGLPEVVYAIVGGNFQPGAGVTLTFWDAPTGGSQHTDLVEIDGVTPITTFTVDTEGEIRRFKGPDAVTVMWIQATGVLTERRRIISVDVNVAGHTHDHGANTDLSADDHTQYSLADGSRGTNTPLAHNQAASTITTGTMDTARLGSGTANNTKYLRGDQTWQTLTAAFAAVAASGAYADLSGTPSVYTQTQIDTANNNVPWVVYYAAGWPGSRPVPTTRPVHFIGPDAQKTTVPGWTLDNDLYSGT